MKNNDLEQIMHCVTKFWANIQKLTNWSTHFGVESGTKVCKSCRSRKMLNNDFLVAKIGVDTAEKSPWVRRGLRQNNMITGITVWLCISNSCLLLKNMSSSHIPCTWMCGSEALLARHSRQPAAPRFVLGNLEADFSDQGRNTKLSHISLIVAPSAPCTDPWGQNPTSSSEHTRLLDTIMSNFLVQSPGFSLKNVFSH